LLTGYSKKEGPMFRTMRVVTWLGKALLAVIFSCGFAVAKSPSDPSSPAVIRKVLAQATNGFLTVSFESISGQWTVTTGPSHPHPNAQVLAPIGTSYITLRDATASVMYTNTLGPVASAGLNGYTTVSMNMPSAFTSPLGTNGFRSIYPVAGVTVEQDVIINGTTLADTNVQQTIRVVNVSGSPRQFGLRTMWDWQISGNTASAFRTRNPDSSFTSAFTTYGSPTFQVFEEVDNGANATFSGFGTVGGTGLNPAPTPPEELRYSSFTPASGSAWDFANTGGNVDSATEFYWGFAVPFTLAPGATMSFTQYLTTQPSAIALAPAAPQGVPAMSRWMTLLVAVLLGGLAIGAVRQRGVD
jgi:hypothetical protein